MSDMLVASSYLLIIQSREDVEVSMAFTERLICKAFDEENFDVSLFASTRFFDSADCKRSDPVSVIDRRA